MENGHSYPSSNGNSREQPYQTSNGACHTENSHKEDEHLEEMKKQLEEMQRKFGFRRPPRPDLEDPDVKWRNGKPNFIKADLEFFRGRSMHHAAGSLEETVENLVKHWEMELSHKSSYEQWSTVDQRCFSLTANGSREFSGRDIFEQGNYQALLSLCRKELYNTDDEDFESSHSLFREAFTEGFPWELVRVLSPPPRVVFTWRHWGRFTGRFRNNFGHGQTISMYGITVADVTDQLKITHLQVFFRPDQFLEQLHGHVGSEEPASGQDLVGSGCPIARDRLPNGKNQH